MENSEQSPEFIPVHLFLSGVGCSVQGVKDWSSHSTLDVCASTSLPLAPGGDLGDGADVGRCVGGSCPSPRSHLPPLCPHIFFLILLDILLLLECTCLAVKMVKVPFLAGEGLAESQCLILTA